MKNLKFFFSFFFFFFFFFFYIWNKFKEYARDRSRERNERDRDRDRMRERDYPPREREYSQRKDSSNTPPDYQKPATSPAVNVSSLDNLMADIGSMLTSPRSQSSTLNKEVNICLYNI